VKSEATYSGDPRHHHTDLAELQAENERLRAEVARLKQTLAFYAGSDDPLRGP
jgi:cell division protein FtsB